MLRTLAVLTGAVLVVGGGSGAPSRTRAATATTTRGVRATSGAAPIERPARQVHYASPVAPLRVVRVFDPPVSRYGAGHLGVDLATVAGQPVRSAADGVVHFAGSIAGRGVVVVVHADAISTEYEPVQASVSVGDVVRRGQVLGLVRGVHGSCGVGRCLHWGARHAGSYLDPLLLLRPLGQVRLLPWMA